ncbi:GAF and ANTAR domain-containing protein [Gordonia metallireducens]|uniref:GAF and ANTAR domain-containing protein n=1 Tax=Gordonia metallireducens TaxID=2897779 RepID=UPI001E516E31|nr:GAF and ANTAR domain-containing protein [Gordonia metallireducens]
MARALHAKSLHGVDAVCSEIAGAATEVIDGIECAGITLGTGNRFRSVAPTDDVADRFGRLQQDLGEGPSFDAARHRCTVRTSDLRADSRWPALAAAVAVSSPLRSAVSYELFTDRDRLGALNVYSTRAGGVSEEAINRGHAFTAHAALMLDAARRHEQFQVALSSRDVIGQAKGMIMERFAVDADRAFDLLRKLSQSSQKSVVEVARQLTSQPGTLAPGDAP